MLSDLLSRLSLVYDFKVNNTETREKTLALINAAGREMWAATDLPGSVMEQVFILDAAQNQVSLPWYVDQVRAMKWRTGGKITLTDARPRYHHSPFRQTFDNYRVKHKTPLHTPLSAESQLRVELGAAETEPITVTIIGQTTTAMRTRQVLRILAGATEATTTLQFTTEAPFGVTDIVKSARTTADVRIYDALDNEVAFIAASERRASNTIVAITDVDSPASTPANAVEVLYKLPYPELYYDEDTFNGMPMLEDAVYWLARSNYHYTFTNEEAMAQAVLEKQNAMEVLAKIVENHDTATENKLQFGPNRYEAPWLTRVTPPASTYDYYRR
jgi:hypothetical protein